MEPSKDQKITRIELSLLRLSDGIASKADKKRLAEHCSSTDLQVWEQLSDRISSALMPTGSIDIAESTMQRLQAETSTLRQISSNTLRNALSDPRFQHDHGQDSRARLNLTDAVMETVLTQADSSSVVPGSEEDLRQPTIDEMTAISAEDDNFIHNEMDDWSFQTGFRSALRDEQGVSKDFTDLIMQRIFSTTEQPDITSEFPTDDLDEDVFVLTSDHALVQVLEDELANIQEDTEADFDQALMLELETTLGEGEKTQEKLGLKDSLPVNTVEATLIGADVGAPELDVVMVTSTDLDSNFDQPPFDDVVEYTEEEFVFDEFPASVNEYEEDSDDLCSVEEELVTEAMLEAQAQNVAQQFMKQNLAEGLQGVLLHGVPPQVNVWEAIATQVNRPPLRILRDDIEVIDKVPTPEIVAEASADDNAMANVEFINSKSIDADSTISKVSITVLGSFLTLAAAWMIIVLPSLLQQNTSSINTPKPTVTFELAEVNHLEVEDLEVAENMNVQILQGDENAPTIIFIDDMETL